jgi:predicted RNase H-like HicB family nuclease
MPVRIETALGADGRWRAEAPELPGILTFDDDEEKARHKASAVARWVIAERREMLRDGLVTRFPVPGR